MPIHGSEREVQRRQDYVRSELMSHGERLRKAEQMLHSALRRLDALERQLTDQAGSVQSGPNDHAGG